MKDLQIVHERSDFLDWLVSNLLDKLYLNSVSPAASLAETSRSAHRILDLRSKAAFQSKSFVSLSLRLGIIKRFGYWLAASWRRYFSRVIFSFKTAWNFIRSQSNPVEWSNLVWHKQKVPKHTFRLWLPRQSSQMKDQGNRDQLPLHYCMGSLISSHHKWAGFEQADKNQFSFQGLSSISRPSISGCKH